METLRGACGWMPLLFNPLPSTHKVPYEITAMVRRLQYLNRSSLAPFCFQAGARVAVCTWPKRTTSHRCAGRAALGCNRIQLDATGTGLTSPVFLFYAGSIREG